MPNILFLAPADYAPQNSSLDKPTVMNALSGSILSDVACPSSNLIGGPFIPTFQVGGPLFQTGGPGSGGSWPTDIVHFQNGTFSGANVASTALNGNQVPTGGTNYAVKAGGQNATVNVSPPVDSGTGLSASCSWKQSMEVNVKTGTNTITETFTCTGTVSQQSFNQIWSSITQGVSDFANGVVNVVDGILTAIGDVASSVASWAETCLGDTLAPPVHSDESQTPAHAFMSRAVGDHSMHLFPQSGWSDYNIGFIHH